MKATKLKLKKIFEDKPCEGCYFHVSLENEEGCCYPDDWSEVKPLQMKCEYFDPNDYATIFVEDK